MKLYYATIFRIEGQLVVMGPLLEQERFDAEQMAGAIPWDDQPEEYRVSGNVICEACARPYWKHERLWPHVGLHRDCDGRALHL